ncbi:hypothetical protein [Methanosarcina thermophila]|uniref:hypothetical protein n=1 Tax=Methanosarcina thermophila TaxID=2210 RepID=UPI000B0A92DA
MKVYEVDAYNPNGNMHPGLELKPLIFLETMNQNLGSTPGFWKTQGLKPIQWA